MKKAASFVSKLPYLAIIAVIVATGAIGAVVYGARSPQYETMIASSSTFKRSVSVSGKVVAKESAELGFDQSGRIAAVHVAVGSAVKAGDLLATLENSDARADVLQKEAALERERAKLASLVGGTRTEQLAIDRQTASDAARSLSTSLSSSFLEAETALLIEVDTMFSNGNSVNPSLSLPATVNDERALESGRYAATEALDAWKTSNDELADRLEPAALENATRVARASLSSIASFINRLSAFANALAPANSGLTQSEIDGYRSTANGAGQTIATAKRSLETAEATWIAARNALILSESGATASDREAQRAVVRSAEADLAAAKARLAKTELRAPFNGVIARMDAKIGQIASPNASPIALMSADAFQIESYVPEVHIAAIAPGNAASVTLDAYGSREVFSASVVAVDPAETVRDGVSTYKVTLAFSAPDPRIRSGMTASIDLVTFEKADAIVLPRAAVIERAGQKYVRILKNNQPVDALVEVGSATALGQVEIVSGIAAGDAVVLDVSGE